MCRASEMMEDELVFTKNPETDYVELSIRGVIYRTVSWSVDTNHYYISGTDSDFANYREAMSGAVELVRSDIAQKEKEKFSRGYFNMNHVQGIDKSTEEVIEEQETLITELKRIIEKKDAKIKKLELAIIGD